MKQISFSSGLHRARAPHAGRIHLMSCWSSAARGWAPDGTGAEGWGAQQGCEWPQLLLGSRGRWLGSVARASLLLFVPAPWDRTSDPRSSCVFLPGTLLTLLHVLCFLPGLVFFPFPSGFPCPSARLPWDPRSPASQFILCSVNSAPRPHLILFHPCLLGSLCSCKPHLTLIRGCGLGWEDK